MITAQKPQNEAHAVAVPESRNATAEQDHGGVPGNARSLIGTHAYGRVYATGAGARIRIESADSRLAYTLLTVPDEAHEGAKIGFAERTRELEAEVAQRAQGVPLWEKRTPEMWNGAPTGRRKFGPVGYKPGVMVRWALGDTVYTGQVWANRVQSGFWSGRSGTCSAVVVATVNGRRARRDEATALPFMHGTRNKRSFAYIAMPSGDFDVTVITPERAADGLFDMVTTTGDPVADWESEGGIVPAAEPAPVMEHASADAPEPTDPPVEASAPVIPAAVPFGKLCPRCDRHALYGMECAYCGHIIITAMLIEPSHPPAWSKGCCPRCLAAAPDEVFELAGRIMCAACADGIGGPTWRERARRVVAWAHDPCELAYATVYAGDSEVGADVLRDVVSVL